MNKAYFKGIDLYDNINPRIMEFYSGEQTVLDIGCGSGLLGKTIKSVNPGAIVYGMDYSDSAGAAASTVLDRFDIVDLDSGVLPAYDRRFDLIVIADVLEHLKRPDLLLGGLHGLLAANGSVLVSVPNVAHFRVRKSLLRGRFRYTDTGILDRTHLKFFTRESLAEMVSLCGFHILGEKYISVLPEIFGFVPHKNSSIDRYITQRFPELVAVQFIVKLQPNRTVP